MSYLGVKLGVLDFGLSLRATLELAPEVEALGYSYYWLAEHQPQPSPINVAAVVAGLTERIRVGTAGILLNFYAPLTAATDFHLLEALYPGRIDAGFCAGGAAPELLTELLDGRPTRTREDFAGRTATLVNHLRNTPATPTGPWRWSAARYQPAEIWLHGNSPFCAGLAAQHGLALGISLCHRPNADLQPLRLYRQEFQSVGALKQPRVALLVAGVCAATLERAQALSARCPLAAVQPNIIGTPTHWRQELERLHTLHQPDAIVVLDLCNNYIDRLESYRLLAEAFDLNANATTLSAAA
jgi:luciferase family oxidoreductase group 1